METSLSQAGKCWCRTCRPLTMEDMRFVVCPECGNKRCPKATDHRHACTNSNEAGQIGSVYGIMVDPWDSWKPNKEIG